MRKYAEIARCSPNHRDLILLYRAATAGSDLLEIKGAPMDFSEKDKTGQD
jgi:hypothetical protein